MNNMKKKSKGLHLLKTKFEVLTENPVLTKDAKPHQIKIKIFKHFY